MKNLLSKHNYDERIQMSDTRDLPNVFKEYIDEITVLMFFLEITEWCFGFS